MDFTIILTENCNFECVYCYQNKDTREFSIEDINDLCNTIGKLSKTGLKSIMIHYFGGEPLLKYDRIILFESKIREICHQLDVEYSNYITTNASLLTDEVLKNVIFDTIQLTFDGFKDTHENIKVSNTFGYDELISKIPLIMKESTSNIRIRFNICKENGESFLCVLEDIFSIEDIDMDRITFNFNPMVNYGGKEGFTELSISEFSTLDFMLRKAILKHGKKLNLPRAISMPCKFTVAKSFCIGPELKTYYCSTDFDNRSLRDFDDLMLEPNINFQLPTVCHKCRVAPLCLASCKLLTPGNNACISEKYIIEDLLQLYIRNPNVWNEEQ